MSAGDVATVLKTVKVFVDFIPDPVKTPVSALLNISISICERVEQVSANVQAVADLAEQQAGISADVVNELRGVTQAQISAGGWIPRLEQLTRALEEVRNCVFKDSEDIEGDSKSGKALKALGKLWNSPEKKKEIDALKAKLDETREQLKLQLDIATLVGVQRITEIARALLQFHDEKLVARLKPVFSARYGAHGSPGDCLPETRLALRSDLRESLTVDDGQRIVWLSGLAGTGKSTVARSICSDLKDTHDVISFFIKRGIVERSDQRRTLHTLVYQLAQCIPRVFSAVVHAKEDLFDAHIHDQVNDLVATPLSTGLPGARPIVIVLDAADERGAASPNECDPIPCFLDAIATATVYVRVLVTSRGHPSDFLRPTYDSDAVHATQGLPQSVVKNISMQDEAYNPVSDIEAYLVEQFKRVAMKWSLLDWPTAEQIDDLVSMSARLFIFAATVIRWVDCPAPGFALDQLLEQSSVLMERTGPDTIFALYEYVIGHALDENTPQQLLRSALGKNPSDRTEADALYREAALSILSTLQCLHEPLTRDAFAQLWAGHLIAEPALYRGGVALAEHLISRLSGVLFVWESDSSVNLLHASFGDFLDFLDVPSSQYHLFAETTNFDLASKCVSIMLSTKDAYSLSCRASSKDPLLSRQLLTIPWISDSDFSARYSFAQWIPHAFRSLPELLPPLLKQVRLTERQFWFAAVFLRSWPANVNTYTFHRAYKTMRIHPEGVEAAYALATALYICADAPISLWRRGIPLKLRDREALRDISFEMMVDALVTLAPLHDPSLSDGLNSMAKHRVHTLEEGLQRVLGTLRYSTVIYEERNTSEIVGGYVICSHIMMFRSHILDTLQALIPLITTELLPSSQHTKQSPADDSTVTWPSNLSTRSGNLMAVLYRLLEHLYKPNGWLVYHRDLPLEPISGDTDWKRLLKEYEDADGSPGGLPPPSHPRPDDDIVTDQLSSTLRTLEERAENFRAAVREFKQQIIKPYDEQVIAALGRYNAGLSKRPAHEGDGPAGGNISRSEGSRLAEGGTPSDGVELEPGLSAGHSLGVDTPRRAERQALRVDELSPPEVGVDSNPSEGQSPQAVTPLPREEHATVTTSAASTIGFFAVLVLLYVLLSSLFA